MYEIYLIYTVSFIAGSILGLLLSYRKYREPFVTERIDPLALAVAVAGWMILINPDLHRDTQDPWILHGGHGCGYEARLCRYETLISAAAASWCGS